MSQSKVEITDWFRGLQNSICKELEALDGSGTFRSDVWIRPEGGGGDTRVITGKLIEKGGVNFSAVHGPTPEKILQALKLEKADFFATGVSIVLHPVNPSMPIIHMNVRYFEMENGLYWFGGGIDLTPHYPSLAYGKPIHQHLKSVCDQTDPAYYNRFKKWADEYFYLPHRQETRGVGGIFFDRLNEQSEGKSKADLWELVKRVGGAFVPIYSHYASQYRDTPSDQNLRKWMLLRRGRYVEFNLVHDKGTKFGLHTNGRTESILMSIPPDASWEYNYQPEPGTPEAACLQWLKKDIDWIGDA